MEERYQYLVVLTPLIDLLDRLGIAWYAIGHPGVMKLRDRELDIDHLRRWAPVLGVADLSERALREARE